MDVSAVSKVLPPSDAFAPQIAATKTSDLPQDQTVSGIEGAGTDMPNGNSQTPQQQLQTGNSNYKSQYVLLPSSNLLVYQVTSEATGYVIFQDPSQEVVNFRNYEAAQSRHEAANKQGQTNIVA